MGQRSEPSTDCTFFFWFYPLHSSIYLCVNFVAESNKIAYSSQLIIVLTTLGMPLTTFPFLTCHSPPTFFLCSPPHPVPLHLSLKSKSLFNLCRCDCNLMINSLKDYFFSSIFQSSNQSINQSIKDFLNVSKMTSRGNLPLLIADT